MKVIDEIEETGKLYPQSQRKEILELIYASYVLAGEKLGPRVLNKHHIDWILNPSERKKEILIVGVWFPPGIELTLSDAHRFVTGELKKRRRFTIQEWYNSKGDDTATTDLLTGDKSFSREEEINRLLIENKRNQIWKSFYNDSQGKVRYMYTVICNYNDRTVVKEWRLAHVLWDPENKWWNIYPILGEEAPFDEAMKELCSTINLTPHSDLLLHWYGDQASILASLNANHDEHMNEFKLQPYPYQKAGIAYGETKKRVFITDEMGLGKSMQAIGIVTRSNAFPCLIICPKSVVFNWKKEWAKFTDIKAIAYGERSNTAQVVITSFENAKHFLKVKDTFASVVVDESHNIRNEGTNRTKTIGELCVGKEYRIFLTGTPMINSPKDFVPQLMALGWLKPETKTKFLQRYVKKGVGVNLEELQVKLRSTCMIRRMKKDVSSELPPVIRQIISCELPNRVDYDLALLDFENFLTEKLNVKEEAVAKIMAAEVLVKVQYLKKLAAKALLPLIVENLKEEIEQGNKVVVFAHHKEIVAALAEALKTDVIIDGSVSAEKRLDMVKLFVENKNVTSIILSIRAGAEGIDGLQEAASLVAFAELDWTAAKHDQGESRLHRGGQQGSVVARYFIPINTVYEKIMEIIERKRRESATATGSQADVIKQKSVFKEFMKELYNVEFSQSLEVDDAENKEETEPEEFNFIQ